MKRNPEYLLREVAGKQIVVPVGTAAVDFPGMITLNETGKFLWEQLETEKTSQDLLEAMLGSYEVEPELAKADIARFLSRLSQTGALLEE